MEFEQNQLPTSKPVDIPAEQPTFDDGGQNAPMPTPAPPPAAQQQEEDPDRESAVWKDDKRAAIFARAKESRAQDAEPFSGDPNDPAARYGTDVDTSDMGDLEIEALRRRQEFLAEQGQQQAPKPLNGMDPALLSQAVRVKVDGEEHEVSIEELTRNYQIGLAADKRLEQAKALLQATQQFQRNQPQPGQYAEYSEPQEQDDAARHPDDVHDHGHTSRRKTDFKDLVEKIQLGTPDEALEALDTFVSAAVNKQAPVDETTRVLTALEDHNSTQAVRAFGEKNPQLVNNPALQAEATQHIYRGMAEDLLRAGYTVDQLREVAPDPRSLTQLHKEARISRLKGVRPVSDLLSAGYQGAINNLRSIFDQAAPAVAPNQAPTLSQRQQRKESLQPQPAARRLSPGLTAPSQSRSIDQSRQAAVQRMRQSRGQPN
jgi:hypothetical protein